MCSYFPRKAIKEILKQGRNLSSLASVLFYVLSIIYIVVLS